MTQAKHTPGPWKMLVDGLSIWAPSAKGGHTKIFDIRGWGYLTGKGHGALGLPDDEAIAIQYANGRLAAAAPELLEALRDVQKLITEAAMTGFNYADGDWPERLFHSQQKTSSAIRKALGDV